MFLNIFLFGFSFLNVFSSVAPFFYVSLFLKTLFGLIILFLSFFFSFYILSLLTRMLNGDFQSESIACVVDTSHSARQRDMDDMVMKRSAANKRDKTSKAKQR